MSDEEMRTGSISRLSAWMHQNTNTPDFDKMLELLATGQLPTGGSGTTDHGELTGLEDDDHSQYHDDSRADARYFTQAQVQTIQSALQGEIDSDVSTHAALANVHHMAFEDDDCDAKITTHTTIAGAHHPAPSDAVYGSGWSTVTDTAPSKKAVYDKIQTLGGGGDVTYLERLGMYGSANAEWVPVIFEMAYPDGDNVRASSGAAVCDITNVVYATAEWLYGLALPPAKNQLKLYVAASGIRFYVTAANATNYITNTWLIGIAENGAVSTIYTDATDYNSAGLKTCANTLQDLSGYEKVFVKLGSTQATASALKIGFVSMKVYYA